MRTLIFSVFLLSASLCFSQEVSISVVCQDEWPPGKGVPVTVIIEKGAVNGFARFYQDIPQGFVIENIESNGADFYYDNNQVNLVWVKLPVNSTIKVRYLVTADESLSGSFRLGGKFDYIVEKKVRKSAEAIPLLIRLRKGVEVLELDDVEKLSIPELPLTSGAEQTNPIIQNVSFRVQVAIASAHLSKQELEDRIGCNLQYSITTLKTGGLYKYQSGSFGKYDMAAEYLAALKECGVKDAFIVAYIDGEQISIELARSLEK